MENSFSGLSDEIWETLKGGSLKIQPTYFGFIEECAVSRLELLKIGILFQVPFLSLF
jgi:hypothetical protein